MAAHKTNTALYSGAIAPGRRGAGGFARSLTSFSLALVQVAFLPTIFAMSCPTVSASSNTRTGKTTKTTNASQATKPSSPAAAPVTANVSAEMEANTIAKPDKTSPEASALAAKIIDALGGYTNFKDFNDLPCRARGQIIQTSSISNVVNTFECDIVVKREKQRITIKFLGQPLTTVYDGKDCWTEQGDSNLPSDKETARRIEEDIQHGFLLLESVTKPDTIMQIGKSAKIEGKDCDALVVWAADGLPTTFYADKEKHIVMASSYPGIDLEQGLKIEKSYHYLDYRPIAKTIQPFKVLEYSGAKKVSETLIESVDVDNSITDATFVMPKEVVPARLLAGPVTVPFDYSTNEIIVEATVNGVRDLRFIVDTGATQSILDRKIARIVGTPTASNLSMTTGAGSIQTEAIKVDKLELGDLKITNIPFATADLSSFGTSQANRPAGLIGANVLKRFLITVDYENQKITFADPTKVEIPTGATAVSTTPSLGMAGMAIEGNIDGKQKVTFLIDTGAAFNNVAESKVKSLINEPLYKVGKLRGLDGTVVQTASARFDYLDLDGLRIDRPVFSIAPQTIAGQKEGTGIIHSKDLAILGNPTLSHYTVTFDYRGQRLIFSQSASQKASASFGEKMNTIKMELLKKNDAGQAVHDYAKLAEEAHKLGLASLEAIVRCELALALCQKNGGSFTPTQLFAPINTRALLAESENQTKAKKQSTSEKLFGDSEGQLLTAFNLSEHCIDKTIQGRVLAAWGLMYASQNIDIQYLASAKQKLSKAVALAPTDAEVLASSGYFLSRLDSLKPKEPGETPQKPSPVGASQSTKAKGKTGQGLKKAATAAPAAPKSTDSERTVLTFKNASELGKWLVDQIVDQSIMIDPGNWLALWSKYERAKSQGQSDDMKVIVGQIRHYYPAVNITPYLR